MTSKTLSVSIKSSRNRQLSFLILGVIVACFFVSTFHLLVEIFMNIEDTSDKIEDVVKYIDYEYIVGNIFMHIISPAFALIIPNAMFGYLNKKSEVDFYHSIPIKRQNVFFTNYIIGLLYFIVPYILIAFLNIIIATTSGHLLPPDTYYKIFDMVMSFIAMYSISTLAAIITGNAFMSICVSLGFMAIPIATFIFNSIFIQTFSETSNAAYNRFFHRNTSMYLTPFTIEVVRDIFLAYSVEIYTFEQAVKNIVRYIPTIAIGFGAGLYYFVKRPSENSGNPVAIKSLRNIIKWFGVLYGTIIMYFIIYSIFNNNDEMVVYMLSSVVFGFLLHTSFEMLFELDVKYAFKNLLHYAIMMATFFVIVFGYKGYAYNYDRTVTSPKSMESATISEYFTNIFMYEPSFFYDIEILNHIETMIENGVYNLESEKYEADGKIRTEFTFMKKNGLYEGKTYYLDADVYYSLGEKFLGINEEFTKKIIYADVFNVLKDKNVTQFYRERYEDEHYRVVSTTTESTSIEANIYDYLHNISDEQIFELLSALESEVGLLEYDYTKDNEAVYYLAFDYKTPLVDENIFELKDGIIPEMISTCRLPIFPIQQKSIELLSKYGIYSDEAKYESYFEEGLPDVIYLKPTTILERANDDYLYKEKFEAAKKEGGRYNYQLKLKIDDKETIKLIFDNIKHTNDKDFNPYGGYNNYFNGYIVYVDQEYFTNNPEDTDDYKTFIGSVTEVSLKN